MQWQSPGGEARQVEPVRRKRAQWPMRRPQSDSEDRISLKSNSMSQKGETFREECAYMHYEGSLLNLNEC